MKTRPDRAESNSNNPGQQARTILMCNFWCSSKVTLLLGSCPGSASGFGSFSFSFLSSSVFVSSFASDCDNRNELSPLSALQASVYNENYVCGCVFACVYVCVCGHVSRYLGLYIKGLAWLGLALRFLWLAHFAFTAYAFYVFTVLCPLCVPVYVCVCACVVCVAEFGHGQQQQWRNGDGDGVTTLLNGIKSCLCIDARRFPFAHNLYTLTVTVLMLAQKDTCTMPLNTCVCAYMVQTYVFIPDQHDEAKVSK